MPADSTISLDDELFEFYRRMADLGIDAGKLKVGLDLRADIRRLGIMRDALSGITAAATDDRQQWYWSPKAVRHIRRSSSTSISSGSRSPRRWDYDGLKLVSRQVRAAVAVGKTSTASRTSIR